MNNHIYDYLIKSWIPIQYIPILARKYAWLYPVKKIINNKSYHLLLADICIHYGVCDKRYCICKFFSEKDKIDCFNKTFCSFNINNGSPSRWFIHLNESDKKIC